MLQVYIHLIWSWVLIISISATPLSLPLHTRQISRRSNYLYDSQIAARDQAKIAARYPSNDTRLERRQAVSIPVTDYVSAGADSQYITQISIGQPPVKLLVLLDTGSSDFWIPGPTSNTSHSIFNAFNSSTYKGSGQEWSADYASGSISGYLCQDTVTLGNATVYQQTFALSNNTLPNFEASFADGILGLGPSSGKQQSTFFENLLSNKTLAQPMFSLFLQSAFDIDAQASDGLVDGGQLVLGGMVDQAHYTGSVNWNYVVDPHYWEIALDGLARSGTIVADTAVGKAVIDSGTSLIYVPTPVADAFYAALGGKRVDKAGHYAIPCNVDESQVQISLSFGGIQYSLTVGDLFIGFSEPSQQYCVMSILATDGRDSSGSPLAIIGAAFLKNVVSVYDSSKQKRLGFVPSIPLKTGIIKPLPSTSMTRRIIATNLPAYSSARCWRVSSLATLGSVLVYFWL